MLVNVSSPKNYVYNILLHEAQRSILEKALRAFDMSTLSLIPGSGQLDSQNEQEEAQLLLGCLSELPKDHAEHGNSDMVYGFAL